MITHKRTIYWVMAAAITGVLFWFGFVHKPAEKERSEKPVPVEVRNVETSMIEETIELTGIIKANRVVYLKSKVPGRIESLRLVRTDGMSVPVEEGLEVKTGSELAVIDHDVYVTEVARARAVVAAAEASMRTYQVELADAERERKRITTLHGQGSATEQSRDKAITAADLAAAKLRMAEAQLAQARAQLKLAEINLRESAVVSPMDGIITKKHIDQGNLINVGDPIVTIANIQTVKVIVGLAERQQAKVQPGTPVRISVDAFADRTFTGTVYSIYPALDEQTRTLQVEIRLANPEFGLRPGMFARVVLITNSKAEAVVAPRDVILGGRIDDKPYVYVVNDEVARKCFIRIGIKQGDRWEITEGLEAGEVLVINGMNYLADGSAVRVVRMEDIK